jgi:hypothetical protein
MPEIAVPFELKVQLLDSSLFGHEFDPETGEAVEPGSRAARVLREQIAERLYVQIPRLGRPQVSGTHQLASFDFDGTLRFIIENIDIIAANALVVGSYDRIIREIALSIDATFQRAWSRAVVAVGPSEEKISQNAEDSLPQITRTFSPRDIGILLKLDLGETTRIGVQASIPPSEQNSDTSKPTLQTRGKPWLTAVLILAVAVLFAIMQDDRSRKSEDRILQALESARSEPVQLHNEVIVNVPPRDAPVLLEEPSAAGNSEDQECIRIIRNGQEVVCE